MGNFVPLIAAFIAIPQIVLKLNSDSFGMLTLIWSLIGYFGVFDLGIGRSLTYEVRLAITENRSNDLGSIILSGVFIGLITGIFGSVLIGCVLAPNAINWFDIVDARNEVEVTLYVIAFTVIPISLYSCLKGVLEGFGKFFESNLTKLVIGCAMFLIPYFLLKYGIDSLACMAFGFLLVRIFVLVITIYWLKDYIHRLTNICYKTFLKLLKFGSWVTVSSIISPIMVYGDRFFVASIVGASVIGYYAVPQEAVQRLLVIPGIMTAALVPRLIGSTCLEIQYLYSKSKLIIGFSMLVVCMALAISGKNALSYWISDDFAEESYSVLLILLVGIWFNSLAQFPMALLIANAKPKMVAFTHISEMFLYGAFIYYLVTSYGIMGAAVAWTLRVTLDYFILAKLAKILLKIKN